MMQAINLYGERTYSLPGAREAIAYAQAAANAKRLTGVVRANIQKHWEELDAARQKLKVQGGSFWWCIYKPLHIGSLTAYTPTAAVFQAMAAHLAGAGMCRPGGRDW